MRTFTIPAGSKPSPDTKYLTIPHPTRVVLYGALAAALVFFGFRLDQALQVSSSPDTCTTTATTLECHTK